MSADSAAQGTDPPRVELDERLPDVAMRSLRGFPRQRIDAGRFVNYEERTLRACHEDSD